METSEENDKAKRLSLVVILVLAVAFILGHAIYGWNLYQTLTSEVDVWTKLLFLAIFAFWLLITVGFFVLALKFWKERKENHENGNR